MLPQDNKSRKQNIRVKTWEEFKRLATEKKPKSIVYIIAQSIPARNLTSLQLILPTPDAQYIFTDSAKDYTLRQMGIRYTQTGRETATSKTTT